MSKRWSLNLRDGIFNEEVLSRKQTLDIRK